MITLLETWIPIHKFSITKDINQHHHLQQKYIHQRRFNTRFKVKLYLIRIKRNRVLFIFIRLITISQERREGRGRERERDATITRRSLVSPFVHGAWHTRVLHRGKAAAVPVGEMEHEAHRKPGSIGVQGAFASNSMHYTSLYTHHQLTTPHPGKRFLGLPLRAGSNIFRSRANAGFRS